jgi:hypothetical protein
MNERTKPSKAQLLLDDALLFLAMGLAESLPAGAYAIVKCPDGRLRGFSCVEVPGYSTYEQAVESVRGSLASHLSEKL